MLEGRFCTELQYFRSRVWSVVLSVNLMISFHSHGEALRLAAGCWCMLGCPWCELLFMWTTDCLMCRSSVVNSRHWKGALCGSADHFTHPCPASAPSLHRQPSVPALMEGKNNPKQRGSVHPEAQHRTLFIFLCCSRMTVFFKFTNIPLWKDRDQWES